MEHIAIIGNGISGITAARHIRKLSHKKITVISSETDYFFSRTALMYVYMGHMKFKHTQPYEDWFWEKNNIALKNGFVTQIDTSQKTLVFSDGEQLEFDKLIIATGSKPNKFGWPGQDSERRSKPLPQTRFRCHRNLMHQTTPFANMRSLLAADS